TTGAETGRVSPGPPPILRASGPATPRGREEDARDRPETARGASGGEGPAAGSGGAGVADSSADRPRAGAPDGAPGASRGSGGTRTRSERPSRRPGAAEAHWSRPAPAGRRPSRPPPGR